MSETKKKMPVFGLEVDVSDVPIVSGGADEQVHKYTLEDGTVLSVRYIVTAMLRVDGQYMPDGSPIYIVYSAPVAKVESSPLMRPSVKGEKVN
jgi:hypothetical protein